MRKIFMISAACILAACGANTDIDGAAVPEARHVASLSSGFEGDLETRFTRLALDCVHREYPNKIAHVMKGDEDVGSPSELHPAFYGCFDWHSSVHGHWLLVRMLHVGDQDAPWRAEAIEKLSANFTPENIASETAYMLHESRASYERPYGLAWYLQLTAELREWDDPIADEWLETLMPLEEAIVGKIKSWLPKLAYPIRLGTHNQSAFAFGLIYDWAETAGDTEMLVMITEKSLDFHSGDKDCNMAYEPSGEDFLSPCLMTADLMRRVMSADDFKLWFNAFMPNIPSGDSIENLSDWLAPGVVKDASDGKLVHLDGVNLSRAWNLEMIANALGKDDPRYNTLMGAALVHQIVGLEAVTDEHYSGSHWLASFATYLITQRGL